MDVNNSPSKYDAAPKSNRRTLALIRAVIYTIVCFIITVLIISVMRLNSRVTDLSRRVSENSEAIAVNAAVQTEVTEDDSVTYFDDTFYGKMWIKSPLTAPLHTYDYSNLEFDENRRYSYSENSEVVSKTGIDVSYHQGDIDWQAVADDGIDFVILRVGYRGYETGLLNLDGNFQSYYEGARDAGLDVGVYFYSQAADRAEAAEEARFVADNISGLEIAYPVVFDWEAVASENHRAGLMTPEMLTECADTFCSEIEKAGYKPMIYGCLKILMCKMDIDALSEYGFWFAEYKDGHNPPAYDYEYQIWQYASDGKVNGIDGDVDMNISFVDYGASYAEKQPTQEETTE